ncbi:MAG: hypothetical protein AB7T49_16455 [Oligoflexales bacterium]
MENPKEAKKVYNQTIDQLVKARVQIHEPTQMEVVFSYKTRSKRDMKKVIPQKFTVDAFFMFPPQMRVSAENYPLERFYQDIRSLIRLREPKLMYSDLIGKTMSARSPILLIRTYIQNMLSGAIADPPDLMEEEARVFACSYFSYFKKKFERLSRSFDILLRDPAKTVQHSHRLVRLVEIGHDLIAKAYQVIRAWREVVKDTQKFEANYLATLKKEIHEVDEYCTYKFRDWVTSFYAELSDVRKNYDPGSHVLRFSTLSAYLRLERWYAGKAGMLWVDDKSNPLEWERYLYQTGAIRRRMWSSLYLNSRKKPLFAIQRQMAAMIAAGIAGAWAISFSLYIGVNAMQSPTPGEIWSLSTFLAITAFTLAYVLKDRIKELGRGWVRGVLGRIPDTSNEIVFNTHNPEQPYLNLGVVQETARFLPYFKLPKDTAKMIERHSHEPQEMFSRWNNFIHYKKNFFMNQNSLTYLGIKTRAVHDVLRINIDSFLEPLDIPQYELLVPTRDLGSTSVLTQKVYYLDFVLKVSCQLINKTQLLPRYHYYRMVMTKKGLERVVTIL